MAVNKTQFMAYLLEEAEKNVSYFLARQVSDPASPDDGGIPEPDRLVPLFPRNTSIRLLEMIAAWLNPGSVFYGDPEIPPKALKALAFLKREQRPSGNIDLWDCNFDSAPDSGFFLWDLVPLQRLLEKAETDSTFALKEKAAAMAKETKDIICKTLEGLRTGGFHTANHRWVMSSSLAAGYTLTGNKAYLDRANQYLAEGIDCNEDGEYSERSAIYNAVNNQAMITLYEELQDKRFLEYVQRNLHMFFYYFEGDGSLFTENSTRQDRGKSMFPSRYLSQYLYIAHYLEDKEAAAVAAWIAGMYMSARRRPAPDCLHFLMLHPELEFQGGGEPFSLPDYNRYFKSSGIVRYKKGKFSYSLLKDNSKWLCFGAGALNGYCKISQGYFSFGRIKIDELEILPDGYRFSYHAEGSYLEPLENPGEPLVDFRKEDHSIRKRQHPNYSDLAVELRNRENGIDVTFTGSGFSRVHYCFEFVLPADIPVSGDHVSLLPKPGDYVLLKDGSLTLRGGLDALRISGGFADSDMFVVSRNADPRSVEGFTVYMNGTVPFSRTVSIESV
jgi:hypothetical protein